MSTEWATAEIPTIHIQSRAPANHVGSGHEPGRGGARGGWWGGGEAVKDRSDVPPTVPTAQRTRSRSSPSRFGLVKNPGVLFFSPVFA